VKKNKGFSLVELIVVIAIICIVSGGLLTAFFSMSGYRSKTASELIGTFMNTTKTEALAKEGAYMIISQSSSGEYMVTQTNEPLQFTSNGSGGYDWKAATGSEYKSLGKNIIIKYETDLGTTVTVNASSPLILSYQRGTGGFKPIQEISASNPTYTDKQASGVDVYCKKITIENKQGTRLYSLTLAKDTGKYVLKREK
jgi:prepilin-type N-terminal cleavage/methylation domain-containing protein